MNLRPSTQQHLASLWPSISETIDRVRSLEIPTELVEIVHDRTPRKDQPMRDAQIRAAHEAGFSASSLAKEYGLTVARIYQITGPAS